MCFSLNLYYVFSNLNYFLFIVVERLRSCEAACELLEKYNMSYQSESNWMDELDSKLRNLEELEAARAKEAWEKHVVSTLFGTFAQFLVYCIAIFAAAAQCDAFVLKLIFETHIKKKKKITNIFEKISKTLRKI